MKNFLLKSILPIIAILIIGSNYSFSQPPQKARERIEQLKKMKLLEVLNLSEEQADKFLVKYSSYEKKLEECRTNIRKNAEELKEALEKKNSNDIKAKTESHLKLEEAMLAAMMDRNRGLKSVLDEVQFAKYLLFEQKFMRELQKAMMKRGDGPDGDEPFMKEKRGRK